MKKGFTLVELLAVLIILGLIIVIAIPSYTEIYSRIKRSNMQSKVTEIETAALKYGNLIKDDVKNSKGNCTIIKVATLIERGYMVSEDDVEAIIYDPTDNTVLDGDIHLCYCKSKMDITANYTVPFNAYKVYHEGDTVTYNDKLYECLVDYTDIHNKNGPPGIFGTNKDGKNYFREVTC
ncbi:MAG: prepilin-type N-terminal cleavage/methylation domain-containing protein [Bacilli bacterium]|nr:prepilin-type N-terminal cleavage/methylation domain-containing protein [Bacilli bacterium]